MQITVKPVRDQITIAHQYFIMNIKRILTCTPRNPREDSIHKRVDGKTGNIIGNVNHKLVPAL